MLILGVWMMLMVLRIVFLFSMLGFCLSLRSFLRWWFMELLGMDGSWLFMCWGGWILLSIVRI